MNEGETPGTGGGLMELQLKQLRKVREHCRATGEAMGLPPQWFKAAERLSTPELVEQVVDGLRASNEKVFEALEVAKRELALAQRREAALRAEVVLLAGQKDGR